MVESWHAKAEREAVERVEAILARPNSDNPAEDFDPWDLFPAVYGSYSSEFDRMAIDVLRDVLAGEFKRNDLASEIFREMLCSANLCDYGSSPRACFPTVKFKAILPKLIARWAAYADAHWGNADWQAEDDNEEQG